MGLWPGVYVACDRLMKNVQQTARLVHSPRSSLRHKQILTSQAVSQTHITIPPHILSDSHHNPSTHSLRLTSQFLHTFSQTHITIPPHILSDSHHNSSTHSLRLTSQFLHTFSQTHITIPPHILSDSHHNSSTHSLRLTSQSLHTFSQTHITIPPHTRTTYVCMSQNMLALTNCMLVVR